MRIGPPVVGAPARVIASFAHAAEPGFGRDSAVAESDPGTLEELRNQLHALQEEGKSRDQAFDQLTRDNLRLQSELEMAEQMAAKGRDNAAREAQELR